MRYHYRNTTHSRIRIALFTLKHFLSITETPTHSNNPQLLSTPPVLSVHFCIFVWNTYTSQLTLASLQDEAIQPIYSIDRAWSYQWVFIFPRSLWKRRFLLPKQHMVVPVIHLKYHILFTEAWKHLTSPHFLCFPHYKIKMVYEVLGTCQVLQNFLMKILCLQTVSGNFPECNFDSWKGNTVEESGLKLGRNTATGKSCKKTLLLTKNITY